MGGLQKPLPLVVLLWPSGYLPGVGQMEGWGLRKRLVAWPGRWKMCMGKGFSEVCRGTDFYFCFCSGKVLSDLSWLSGRAWGISASTGMKEGVADGVFWADKCLSLFCLVSLIVSLWMETQGSAVLVFCWCRALGGAWISAWSPRWAFSGSVS